MQRMCLAVALYSAVATASALSNRDELFSKYNEIFPNGNRNAASHRWATYILERSADMSEKVLRDLFAGFCPVSGSPLSYQRGVLRVKMMLPAASGGNVTGMMYYCCWPCICDTADFIKVDTKTVQTSDGMRKLYFAVIGNPCKNPEAVPSSAPDVNCKGEQLVKATLSDNGHIIIGMFFELGVEEHSDGNVGSTDQQEMNGQCQQRAASGYNSGMGRIFREVASISPVQVNATGQEQQMESSQRSELIPNSGADSASVAPKMCSSNTVLTIVMCLSVIKDIVRQF